MAWKRIATGVRDAKKAGYAGELQYDCNEIARCLAGVHVGRKSQRRNRLQEENYSFPRARATPKKA